MNKKWEEFDLDAILLFVKGITWYTILLCPSIVEINVNLSLIDISHILKTLSSPHEANLFSFNSERYLIQLLCAWSFVIKIFYSFVNVLILEIEREHSDPVTILSSDNPTIQFTLLLCKYANSKYFLIL